MTPTRALTQQHRHISYSFEGKDEPEGEVIATEPGATYAGPAFS